MENSIVSTSGTVLLIGGGPLPKGAVSRHLGADDLLVACDGGVRHVLAEGLRDRLAAVIGDMDSLPGDSPGLPLYPVNEQDSTDFDKALRAIDAALVIGLGFWEGRADHAMAALSVLLTRIERRCILLAGEDVIFAAPPVFEMSLEAGARVSIWPLLPVTGRSEGLDWPIDGLSLDPVGRLGTSNRASGGRVRIAFDAPGAILALPRDRLRTAAEALRAAGPWPSHARAG